MKARLCFLVAICTLSCLREDDPAVVRDMLAAEASIAPVGKPPLAAINPRLLRRFQPVTGPFESPTNERTEAKVELGRMLFHDPRLSRDKQLACSTCHPLEHYGSDGRRRRGERDVPTVYNAAGALFLGWDGASRSVEEQALLPMTSEIEMAMNEAHTVQRLSAIGGYVSAFAKAFPDEPDPINHRNLGRAIGAFERGLITQGRWDDFLSGASDALTATEKRGLRSFINIGCMTCHTGVLLGGSMITTLGQVEPWPNTADGGRYEVTAQESDRMRFRVPTLRNVAQTAPYFHDGSSDGLDDAVRRMARHQLGLRPDDNEVKAIVAWLRSLTGEVPVGYIQRPTLPPDTLPLALRQTPSQAQPPAATPVKGMPAPAASGDTRERCPLSD